MAVAKRPRIIFKVVLPLHLIEIIKERVRRGVEVPIEMLRRQKFNVEREAAMESGTVWL
jgi:hypothetical protein